MVGSIRSRSSPQYARRGPKVPAAQALEPKQLARELERAFPGELGPFEPVSDAVALPEEHVACKTRRSSREEDDVLPAREPEPVEVRRQLDPFDAGRPARHLLQQPGAVPEAELAQEHRLRDGEDDRDDAVLLVEPGLAAQVRQEHGHAQGSFGLALRHRPAEADGERALLGGRKGRDELDRGAAEVEEAQDRTACLRHRECDPDCHERERDRDDEQAPPARPSRPDRLEPELKGRRLRPFDLRRESGERTLELSHTAPSGARAPAPSAT
jgi:hypothetical protein